MVAIFAILDFGEVNIIVFGADNIDLVEVGLVVALDNGVAAIF